MVFSAVHAASAFSVVLEMPNPEPAAHVTLPAGPAPPPPRPPPGGPRRHRRNVPLEVGVLPNVYELPGTINVHPYLSTVELLDREARVRKVGDGRGYVVRDHTNNKFHGRYGLGSVERAHGLCRVHVISPTRPQPGDHEIEDGLLDEPVLLGARVGELLRLLPELLPAHRCLGRRRPYTGLVEEILVVVEDDRPYVVPEGVQLAVNG